MDLEVGPSLCFYTRNLTLRGKVIINVRGCETSVVTRHCGLSAFLSMIRWKAFVSVQFVKTIWRRYGN